MAGYRYWRLSGDTLSTSYGMAIAELRFQIVDGSMPTIAASFSSSHFDGQPANLAFDGNPNTCWSSNNTTANNQIGVDFGVPIDVTEISIAARNDGYYYQAPVSFDIQRSDDGAVWETVTHFDTPATWSAGEVRTFDLTAIAGGVQAVQGYAVVVTNEAATTHDLRLSQGYAFAPFNVPAKNMRASEGSAVIVSRVNSVVAASQAHTFVVCKGRKADPTVRAFTFTLDGHDFYVLRLGEGTTLVYDVSTGQWPEWTSPDLPFWRINASHNWIGAEKLAYQFGSNILVGDDTFGLLYFLDAEQPYDQHPDLNDPQQQMPFERIVMGQYLVSGRDYAPCYVVFLDTDNYGLGAVDFVPGVTLDTSDNQGVTFDTWGTITVNPATDDIDYRWTSLGQMHSPGRLFRVTDKRLLTRIDAMSMNDDNPVQ